MPLMTTTSDIPINIKGWYDRALLERAVPLHLFGKFGQVRPLPKNQGDRANFRRYGALAANTTPLVEGVTPSGKKLSVTDLYASVLQYGDFVTVTDWLSDTGVDPNIVGICDDVLGEQAGLSLDTVYRNVLVAGTSVRYANGVAARVNVTTAINDADVASTITTLEANNAKMLRELVQGGSKINTYAIRPCFVAVSHPHCRYDIERLQGFTSVELYSSQGTVMDGEIGAVKNLRFCLTTNSKIWGHAGAVIGATGLRSDDATNIDVYATLVFAKNAYGMIPLQKRSIESIVKKVGSAGADDPLNQRGTVGWKAVTACKILNDDFMVRIEHGATSL